MNCNNCNKTVELLYGYKAYEMKDDEFYCNECILIENPDYFIDILKEG